MLLTSKQPNRNNWAFESACYSANEPHKNNYSLSEAQLNIHLIKVRVGLRLANSVEIWDIDELKVKEKSRVFYAVLWPSVDMREVAKLRVSPVIQITQAKTNKIQRSVTSHALRIFELVYKKHS